jgi:ABC-type transporter Mla MlaB component
VLKISQNGPPARSVTLTLEGRVVGPWVEELRRLCEPLLAEDRVLELDLANVSYVDAEGVAALNRFVSRGVTLNNCSPFVRRQIQAFD